MKECGSATAYYEIRAQLKAESKGAASPKSPKLSLKDHTKLQKQRRLQVADMRRRAKESDRLACTIARAEAQALCVASEEECKVFDDVLPLETPHAVIEYQMVSLWSTSIAWNKALTNSKNDANIDIAAADKIETSHSILNGMSTHVNDDQPGPALLWGILESSTTSRIVELSHDIPRPVSITGSCDS